MSIIQTVGLEFGMKGFLRLRTRNKFSGKIIQDTNWFPNTILDSGRNNMSVEANWLLSCQVGTDGTAPSQSDTALLGHVAGTSNIVSVTSGNAPTAPYYGWKRLTYRFDAGTVAANLNEAGIGWGETGSTLISRARILDPVLQIPTTITPLIDELLEVLYEIQYYPPLVDVVLPQVTLDGVVYDTITRASGVTDPTWSASIGLKIGVVTDYRYWDAWDGTLGTILLAPNGNSADCDTSNQYNSSYSNNSYEQQVNCPVGSQGWNLGSGIRSVRIRTTAGDYQTQFTAASGGATIPKSVAYNMLMSWKLAWVEKV